MRITSYGRALSPGEITNFAFMTEVLTSNLASRAEGADTAGKRFLPLSVSEARLLVQHTQSLVNTLLAQKEEIDLLRRSPARGGKAA